MNNTRTLTLGAALAIIAIVALGWFLGVAPAASQARAAVAETESVDAQNLAQEAVLVGLRQQLADMNDLNMELSELQEEVPPEADVETFLDEVTVLAGETGVTLTTFTADEPIMFSGVAVPEGDAAVAAEETTEPAATESVDAGGASGAVAASGLEGRLFTIGVSIGVTGAPEQVMDFTGALQEGNRLFLSTAVGFDSAAEPVAGTLTGHIFVVRSTPGAVTPPPAG